MATQLSKGEGARVDGAPVWNSLEAAKIAVGALTPISLFLLGFIVTTTSTKEERDYQSRVRIETANRERQARIDAIAREDKLRDENIKRDDKLREENIKREAEARAAANREARLAREEAFRREEQLGRAADARAAAAKRLAEARETQLREAAQEQARKAKIYEKRLELWNSASPILASMKKEMEALVSRSDDVPINDRLRVLKGLKESFATQLQPYTSYFSDDFDTSLHELIDVAELQMGAAANPAIMNRDRGFRKAHDQFVSSVRRNLAPD